MSTQLIVRGTVEDPSWGEAFEVRDSEELPQLERAYADVQLIEKSVDLDNRTIDYVMSDDSVDSYGEVVEQVWVLDRYSKNPVVLYGHNRNAKTPKDTLPIGRVVKGPKREGNKSTGYRLVGTVQFAPEEVNEFAEEVWKMVSNGYLKGGSVGFYPHDIRREVRDDAEVYILSKNELFEFSVAPIGANANSVTNSLGSREERRARLAKLCQKSQPVAASGQENTMNEKEFQAKLAELEKSVEEARANEKAALELAQANEAKLADVSERASVAEKSLESTKQELETAAIRLADVESVLAGVERAENATVADVVKSIIERADTLESEVIEAELDSYQGLKFHAGEREFMREDRKSFGKDGFAKRMAARADLNTSKTKLPEDNTPSALTTLKPAEVPGAKTLEHLKAAR